MSAAPSPSDIVSQPPAVQGGAAAGAQGGAVVAGASAKPKRKTQVIALVLLLAAAIGARYWWTHRFVESTDNAQVDGEVIAVPARTGGTIAQVLFTENQKVK